MIGARFPLVPYAVDYEYIPRDDGGLDVVCGVSKNLLTGHARRHAIASLQNTDLFEVTQDGKKAASVSVGKKMRKILGR